MKFFRILLLQFIALSGFVYASSDSDKSREFYLCVKVKKNPVEQCSNKIFGKKDSLKLFTIAKAQVAALNLLSTSRPSITNVFRIWFVLLKKQATSLDIILSLRKSPMRVSSLKYPWGSSTSEAS